jgi:ATP-dependent Clp protease ATP-binding subunit ClpA
VVLPLVAVSGLIAAVIYMLRFDRRLLARSYRYPIAKQLIDVVCRMVSQQPPVEKEEPRQGEQTISLREPRDFVWAAAVLKERLFGHDRVIDALVDRLRENVILRQRSPKSVTAPVGVFLLAGSEGIGKRTMAHRLARLLYREGHVTTLRIDDYRNDEMAIPALFGGTGQEGHLLGPVKRKPFQTMVLENIEAAGPKLAERLQAIFARGSCTDPANGAIVSFVHCLFILTTTKVPPGIDSGKLDSLPSGRRHEFLVDALSVETGLGKPLLGIPQEILFFNPPNEMTRARVVTQMMRDECAKYGIRLDYVDPEIIAEEVAAWSATYGFQLSESRIAKQLRQPIVQTSQHNLDALVLTREMLSDSRKEMTCS